VKNLLVRPVTIALRYLLSKISLCLALKLIDQSLLGSDLHKTEAQRVTIASVGVVNWLLTYQNILWIHIDPHGSLRPRDMRKF
jgi:hypothetical protein